MLLINVSISVFFSRTFKCSNLFTDLNLVITARGHLKLLILHWASYKLFMEAPNDSGGTAGAEVLPFDYSVENHFQAMDMIARLCGEEDTSVDDMEIARLSSSIKFLRYCLDLFLSC